MSTPRPEKGCPFGPFVAVLGRVEDAHLFRMGNDLLDGPAIWRTISIWDLVFCRSILLFARPTYFLL